MSFENMKDREEKILHEKVCVLLYNFAPNEIKQLQNVAKVAGISDTIVLKPENGNQTIRAILDGEDFTPCLDTPKEKAVLFNGIVGTRVNTFIELLKKFRFRRPLIALVTEQSIEWQLKVVIENLIEERSTLSQNKMSTHQNK